MKMNINIFFNTESFGYWNNEECGRIWKKIWIAEISESLIILTYL